MMIKEFEAATLKECLNQVRQELGPEAVILETKKLQKRGVMGLGAHEAIKVVAATGIAVDDRPQSATRRPVETAGPERRIAERAVVEPQARLAPQPPAPRRHPRLDADNIVVAQPTIAARESDSASAARIVALERQIRELKSGFDTVRETLISAALPPEPQRSAQQEGLIARLVAAEVPEGLACDIAESMPDDRRAPVLADRLLASVMSARIACGGAISLVPGRCKVVALIGPTGVGKTTTIAKLAAHYALVEKRRVGLVTLDTYRIAAVEQLRTYSQIMGIPLRVANSPAEIGPALDAMADFDLVLIDTAGRSQKNMAQINELKRLLQAAACETHLVLSASTKLRDLEDQMAHFGPGHRVIFTKLDETSTFGTIYALAALTGIPVSYLTIGQKVPEDIETASSAKLAALVLDKASTPEPVFA